MDVLLVPGKLEVINSKHVKELFETAMPVFRAARGAEILVIGPLQRYIMQKCCGNPATSPTLRIKITGQRLPVL